MRWGHGTHPKRPLPGVCSQPNRDRWQSPANPTKAHIAQHTESQIWHLQAHQCSPSMVLGPWWGCLTGNTLFFLHPGIGPGVRNRSKIGPKNRSIFLFLEITKNPADWPGNGALVEAYAKGSVLKPAGLRIVAHGMPGAKTGHCPKYHLPKGSTAPIILTSSPVQPKHDFEPKWPLDQVGWLKTALRASLCNSC